MNILKMFGVSTAITPTILLTLSILFNAWMPIGSYITLTILFAIPNFIGLTLIKGLYKVLKLVWR